MRLRRVRLLLASRRSEVNNCALDPIYGSASFMPCQVRQTMSKE